MDIKNKHIIDFLSARNWRKIDDNKFFIVFEAPSSLQLQGYTIQVPKEDTSIGAKKYLNRVMENISSIYPNLLDRDSEYVLIDKKTILSTRVHDNDTINGTISFDRLRNIYYYQSRILKQAVTFAVSKKQIFGEAELEVKELLDKSRALQTEEGSFITKVLLPSNEEFLFREVNVDKVSDTILNTLDYVNRDIMSTDTSAIDKNYIKEHDEVLNIELLREIYNIIKHPNAVNIDFGFNSVTGEKFCKMRQLTTKKIGHFNKFIKKSKAILMEEEPLTAIGSISKLYSKNISTDSNNYVELSAVISNVEHKIKVYLNSDNYLEAVEAHSELKKVKIVGLAKHLKSQYIVSKVDEFSILD
jgi:hypothetical protein